MDVGVLQVLLIAFASINLAFAGLVYFHGNRGAVITFYALISFFASLWSLATLFTGVESLPFFYFKLAISGHYIAGFLAYLSFFWLSLYYPRRILSSKILPIAITLLTVGLLAFIPTTDYLFTTISSLPGALGDRIEFSTPGYLAFVISLSIVFVTGLAVLLVRLTKTAKRERYRILDKHQMVFLILSNLIAGTLGITLNLILPFFGNFSFFYINPILVTVALTGIGLYNLFKFNLFNLKVVIAEVFTIGIWVASFTQIVLSDTQTESIASILLFVATVIFGVFLIRSVVQEVKTREEIERLADSLEQANERLKELDKLKSEFVSIASHQLRAPLTSIKGYASLILESSFGKVSDSVREAVQRIFDSSEMMVSSVEDFLNVSRIEQGRMDYRFDVTDAAEITRAVIDEMMPIAKKKQLTLAYSTEQGETYPIKADVGKLTQVLTNLVDNAIKYTLHGTVGVKVSRNNQTGKIRIAIADTGIGMSEKTISRLFDKFVRAENANEVNVGGTGLGLYVAAKIIKAHQGRIWAESKGANKGSVFYVELNLSKT